METATRESIKQLLQKILTRGQVVVTHGRHVHDEGPNIVSEQLDMVQDAWLTIIEFLGLIKPDGKPFPSREGGDFSHGEKSQRFIIVPGKEQEIRSLCVG